MKIVAALPKLIPQLPAAVRIQAGDSVDLARLATNECGGGVFAAKFAAIGPVQLLDGRRRQDVNRLRHISRLNNLALNHDDIWPKLVAMAVAMATSPIAVAMVPSPIMVAAVLMPAIHADAPAVARGICGCRQAYKQDSGRNQRRPKCDSD